MVKIKSKIIITLLEILNETWPLFWGLMWTKNKFVISKKLKTLFLIHTCKKIKKMKKNCFKNFYEKNPLSEFKRHWGYK